MASIKATDLLATSSIWHLMSRRVWSHYPAILMILPCSLSQVTNDQTGTVHKHIKNPLGTLNNWLSCFGKFIKMALNRYCLHFSRNNGKLIISALCDGEGCSMGVRSTGAPLKSQICPLFTLRCQTANDYLALGFWVVLRHARETDEFTCATTPSQTAFSLWSVLTRFMFVSSRHDTL